MSPVVKEGKFLKYSEICTSRDVFFATILVMISSCSDGEIFLFIFHGRSQLMKKPVLYRVLSTMVVCYQLQRMERMSFFDQLITCQL